MGKADYISNGCGYRADEQGRVFQKNAPNALYMTMAKEFQELAQPRAAGEGQAGAKQYSEPAASYPDLGGISKYPGDARPSSPCPGASHAGRMTGTTTAGIPALPVPSAAAAAGTVMTGTATDGTTKKQQPGRPIA